MSFRSLTSGAVVMTAAAALVVAGCSSSDSGSDEGSGGSASAAVESTPAPPGMGLAQKLACNPPKATPGPESTAPLKIGTLLPETGSLAFLGPPMVAGVNLAIKDINAAGGVLDKPVELVTGDSGDTTTDTANATVDRELSAGTQVIIGAASSSVSLKVIDKIANAGAVMFSPANTSDEFTCYQDKGQYFRTAPADVLQAQALSQTMAEDGVQRVSILALNDPYGTGLADNTVRDLEAAGVPADQIQKIIYDPNAQSFNAEVDQVKNFNPDGVALIGFEESAKILTRMHEVGIGPSDGKLVYGVDGNMGNALGESVGSGLLKGMKGTTPLTQTSGEFQSALKDLDPKLIDFNYSGESYDAAVLSALAATAAKSTDGRTIAANIIGVTNGDENCDSYQACLDALKSGKTIAYVGKTGNLAFNAAGEPSVGSYGVLEFDGDNKLLTPTRKYVSVAAQ
ncbi:MULTISPECIES: ABC transporter substrate-binding protein [Gordonia]|uniref:Amino acid ABC transporter substrate-binding protein n=2 Tax=Gordonia TaxID=2053 RepID=W9DCZ7_9ACTN|nr:MULTISPECIES: ABC transporter substrate-binding protein [Gordonia]AZZ82647.1 amino acid ABC transporter substrate-binding protein [Gordonia alkanivorans]ETA06279.1 amino acid ABC transporter substrate-binding protein [Gordonia alkanivorans CGMCC 6845]MDH3008089.1 ABC transporter substrate-binding protein [Gordonia alkanivorans]MDH3011690.1 ABC transporter substrate-binding protein [Gordonia alkanivorans]MDH3016852.1 ABC transporter substrate-binding protein [Gordonia alkanivorans]